MAAEQTKTQQPNSPSAQPKQKRLTVNLPPDVHRAFKVWCTQQGREMSEVVVEFVNQCLKEQSK